MERLRCQWTLVAPVLLLAVFLSEKSCACLPCPESLQQCSSRECFTCDHVPASCDVDENYFNISCTVDTQSCSYQTCDECSYCVLVFHEKSGNWTFNSLCLSHRCVSIVEDMNTVCQRRSTQEECYFERRNPQQGFHPSHFFCTCYGKNCSSPHGSYVYTHPPTTPTPPDVSPTVTLGNMSASSSSSPLPRTPHDSTSTAPVHYWIIIAVLVLLVLSGLMTFGVVLVITQRARIKQQTIQRPRCTNPTSFQNLSGKQVDVPSCATTMSELEQNSL